MSEHDCEGCASRSSRRDFMRDAARAGLAVLLTLGASERAAAASLRFISGAANSNSVTYPLPAADGAHIDRQNEVILVRWQQAVYAFNLACPHQRTALRWIDKDARFQCPKHKSKYQPDGTFISGRATRGMDRLALHRDGENVVVETDKLYQQDEQPAAWQSALIRL